MAQGARRIDTMVKDAIRRARRSGSAWTSREVKQTIAARSALRSLTSSSPMRSTFESIRGLLPFAAGMIDVLSISPTNDLTSFIYDVPDGFLAARARLIDDDPAIPLAAALPAGLALRGPDALGGGAFQRVPYMKAMYPRFGLDNVTGMILSTEAHGATQEVNVLWLFSGRGVRLPTWRECRLLELICGDLREAMDRVRLPLIPHQKILFQILQEQSLGYIVLRSNGEVIEANRTAVLLSEKYGPRGAASWRSRIDELLSAAQIGAQRGSLARRRIPSPDGAGVLELHAHRLAKEHYAISEDVTLVQLKETPLAPSSVERERDEPLRTLPRRRREVAALLATSGLSYKQIADRLALSEGTVRKHAELAYRALGVHSRPELIALVGDRVGDRPTT